MKKKKRIGNGRAAWLCYAYVLAVVRSCSFIINRNDYVFILPADFSFCYAEFYRHTTKIIRINGSFSLFRLLSSLFLSLFLLLRFLPPPSIYHFWPSPSPLLSSPILRHVYVIVVIRASYRGGRRRGAA